MKKNQPKQRKLRKKELPTRRKTLAEGCRYNLGLDGVLRPFK